MCTPCKPQGRRGDHDHGARHPSDRVVSLGLPLNKWRKSSTSETIAAEDEEVAADEERCIGFNVESTKPERHGAARPTVLQKKMAAVPFFQPSRVPVRPNFGRMQPPKSPVPPSESCRANTASSPQTTTLPYYDHLLQGDNWRDDQSGAGDPERLEHYEIHWFSVAFEMDPNVKRYQMVMEAAAKDIGAEFQLTLWEPTGMLGLI